MLLLRGRAYNLLLLFLTYCYQNKLVSLSFMRAWITGVDFKKRTRAHSFYKLVAIRESTSKEEEKEIFSDLLNCARTIWQLLLKYVRNRAVL